MEPLPLQYKRSGMLMRQIERTENVAFYEILLNPQVDHPQQRVIGYEVFKIIKMEETEITMGGQKIKLKAKEISPSNEMFGKIGFSYGPIESERERAKAKFQEMSSAAPVIDLEDFDIDLDLKPEDIVSEELDVDLDDIDI